ncbi:response regulator transcription factor [Tunturibacter empetritectus]|uniref:Two-component system KDP operon response regulator KdpE n=1 Tax=Tunturiibacter empetritectus TaxID=3069691 RepID=A0A7W8IHJ9_9BACT|nr:response regulator transcription factor [Edaphobacter lichenicola]MBB5317182.1 two-component system KDP operon response regulator KdpE [Edaphobacter lichenicola]
MKQNLQDQQHAKILIVDDEAQITRVLRTALSTQGYSLRIAANGVEGMEAVHEWKPDLVVTDVSMPEMNGIELCREIRAVSTVPIIVLSVRNQEAMKIEALDAGADDYVTKPFSIQELQARVRAQLRRSSAAESEAPQIISAGDFYIDIPQHRVVVRGQDTHLTPKQFDLLVFLAQHPGQVLTHRALLHAVWGTNADQPEYLRVNIGQLRKKIELAEEPAYIITEPWIGYRFRPTGNDEF